MEWDYSTPHTWQHSRSNQRIVKALCVNAVDKSGDFIFTINHAKLSLTAMGFTQN